jgi:hypothetical protein
VLVALVVVGCCFFNLAVTLLLLVLVLVLVVLWLVLSSL